MFTRISLTYAGNTINNNRYIILFLTNRPVNCQLLQPLLKGNRGNIYGVYTSGVVPYDYQAVYGMGHYSRFLYRLSIYQRPVRHISFTIPVLLLISIRIDLEL